MENERPEGEVKSTRHRSPAYPAFNVQVAIEKAKTFYAAQKRNPAHIDVTTEILGYKRGSSQGTRAIAALLSYGILEEEGAGPERTVKLTSLGRSVAMLDDDDPDWLDAVRDAARNPKIFSEMLTKWEDGLPDDRTIQKFLAFTKNYNPEVIPGLIRDFKATYDFAGFGSDDVLADEDIDKTGGRDDNGSRTAAHRDRTSEQPTQKQKHEVEGARGSNVGSSEVRILHFALPNMRLVEFKAPAVLTKRDIKVLRRHLDILDLTIDDVDAVGQEMDQEAD